MREPVLKVILAAELAFFASIGFATTCVAQTDNLEKCGPASGSYSILLPKPLIDKSESADAGMYIAKANGVGYVVTIVRTDKTWKEKTKEEVLADFIKGHQDGYSEDEKKSGREVTIKFLSDIKGDGWFGKMYSFNCGKVPGYWKYALNKNWIYVITALNDETMSAQTKTIFDSLVVSDKDDSTKDTPQAEASGEPQKPKEATSQEAKKGGGTDSSQKAE